MATTEQERYEERARNAEARASRQGALADHFEQKAAGASPARAVPYASLAAIHRQNEARHLAVAGLYARHLARFPHPGEPGEAPGPAGAPRLIESVAAGLGASSAYLELSGAVIASDATARAVHDAELVLGEGPAHTCVRDGPIIAGPGTLRRCWPRYAHAVAALGVTEVGCAPIAGALGALTALCTTQRIAPTSLDDLRVGSEALVDLLLAETEDPGPSGLLAHLDHHAELHQAAGAVAAQQGCTTDTALVLIRARAFATGLPLADLVRHVNAGRVHLEA